MLYSEPGMLEAYHKQLGSQLRSVGPWTADMRRKVCYQIKVKLPAIAKSFIGAQAARKCLAASSFTPNPADPTSPLTAADSLAMVESQSAEWSRDADGAAVCSVLSVPTLQVPGGERFTSPTLFEFAQRGGDVAVRCSVRCTAALWGLAGTIEPMMLAEATATLRGFLDFCVAYFEAAMAARRATAALGAPRPAHRRCTPPLTLCNACLAAPGAVSQAAPLLRVASVETLAAASAVGSGTASPAAEEAVHAPTLALRLQEELFFDTVEPLDPTHVLQRLSQLEALVREGAAQRLASAEDRRALLRRVDGLQDALVRVEAAAAAKAVRSWQLSPTTLAFLSGLALGAAMVGSAVAVQQRRS